LATNKPDKQLKIALMVKSSLQLVFNPISYEGGITIDKIYDPVQKRAMITQIQEFGQTPRQLFKSPHVERDPPPKDLQKHESMIEEDRRRETARMTQFIPATMPEEKKTPILVKNNKELSRRTSKFTKTELTVVMRKHVKVANWYDLW